MIKITGKSERLSSIYSYLLVSNYDDTYELTTKDIYKLTRLEDLFFQISKYVTTKKDITIKVSSGFRTKKINKLAGGSSTSQHLYFEAMDLHFYKKGKEITGVENMKEIASIIDEMFEDMIQQMFWYDWGIHIGIATSRKRLKKVRGAR